MGTEPTITIRGHKFDAYQVDAYWLGMEEERERIMNLLEERIRKSNQELNVVDGNWYPAMLKLQRNLSEFITLIKEETE